MPGGEGFQLTFNQLDSAFSARAVSGAGSIDKNPVKKAGKSCCQPAGMLIGHQRIGNAHAFYIAAEDLGAAGNGFVAHNKACAAKRGMRISGGEFDTERMARVLLDEYRGSKLGRFTLERPEQE